MSSISIYSEIKDQVDTRKAAELYGFKVGWNGMMCCPFHDDKTPSMKVDKNFICFGCGEKGDVIRFVSLLFNLKPYDAAMKLVDDMRLTVTVPERFPVRSNRRKKTVTKPEPKITEKQLYDWAIDRFINVYSDYYRLLTEWKEKYAPVSFDDEFHPLFMEAIYNMSYVEYLLDTLSGRSEEEIDQIVIEKAKGLEDLEKRIKKYRSGEVERAARSGDPCAGSDVCAGNQETPGCEREGSGEEQHH